MNRHFSKSGLFLMELMIAVLFFGLCAGVCLSMFAKAHQMSVRSQDLTRALNAAQQAAECFKEDTDKIPELLGGYELEDGLYAIYYDDNWNISSAPGVYETRVVVASDGLMATADIAVLKKGVEIYQVEVKKYGG